MLKAAISELRLSKAMRSFVEMSAMDSPESLPVKLSCGEDEMACLACEVSGTLLPSRMPTKNLSFLSRPGMARGEVGCDLSRSRRPRTVGQVPPDMWPTDSISRM
jgi:hypothetical protein